MAKKKRKDRNPITRWKIISKNKDLFNPNNKVVICGLIDEELEYNHREKGQRTTYYRTVVKTVEENGRINKIPIYLSKEMHPGEEVKGKWIEIAGIIRTYRGNAEDGHRYLSMGVYATEVNIYDDMEKSKEKSYINSVYLKGVLNIDAYSTYGNKTDMQIIVTDPKRKDTYCIPCIVLGVNVKRAERLKTKDKISFFEKFQSKTIPENKKPPERTAYEVAMFKYREY